MKKKFEDKFMKLTVEDMKDIGEAMADASDLTVMMFEDKEAWVAGALTLAKKLGCKGDDKHVQIASVQLGDAIVKYLRTCEKYCSKK